MNTRSYLDPVTRKVLRVETGYYSACMGNKTHAHLVGQAIQLKRMVLKVSDSQDVVMDAVSVFFTGNRSGTPSDEQLYRLTLSCIEAARLISNSTMIKTNNALPLNETAVVVKNPKYRECYAISTEQSFITLVCNLKASLSTLRSSLNVLSFPAGYNAATYLASVVMPNMLRVADALCYVKFRTVQLDERKSWGL